MVYMGYMTKRYESDKINKIYRIYCNQWCGKIIIKGYYFAVTPLLLVYQVLTICTIYQYELLYHSYCLCLQLLIALPSIIANIHVVVLLHI